jgi:hypothetical protein
MTRCNIDGSISIDKKCNPPEISLKFESLDNDTYRFVFDLQRSDDEYNPPVSQQAANRIQYVQTSVATEYTQKIQWKNRSVRVKPFFDPSILCEDCGESVSLSRSDIFSQPGETTVPRKDTINRNTIINNMDNHSSVCLKMYMFGALDEKCRCHDSNQNV